MPRVFSQAVHIMRSGRPGPVLIDLPLDVQLAEIESDAGPYEPLPSTRLLRSGFRISGKLCFALRPRFSAEIGGGNSRSYLSDLESN